MRVWRLVQERYREEIWTGEGGFRFGGRWNSPGRHVVYTSGSLALAALEFFVHLDPKSLHAGLIACGGLWPDEAPWAGIALADLPQDWIQHPELTRSLGDDWLRSDRSAVLRVPSVVVPGEPNYLINPHHPKFVEFRPEPPLPWRYDVRMLAR